MNIIEKLKKEKTKWENRIYGVGETRIDLMIEDVIRELQKYQAELEKKDKRISDLEFALMDMVLQFADENKDSINTMGLSALEIAFSELDFDNPMPIKEVHKRYKKLAQEYYKVEREGK